MTTNHIHKTAASFKPELSFPLAESEALRGLYADANVILEYGSGGSTVLASQMTDKLVFSVESDADWGLNLQRYIDSQDMPSPAIMHFVDIGVVGAWGRPVDSQEWHKFYRYPLDIWDQPFFRHPDVVLIDGRFRAACLITTQIRIQRPVTVIFDDYAERPLYHEVEHIIGKPKRLGRMAIFELKPKPFDPKDLSNLLSFMAQVTYVKGSRYDV